MNLFNRIRVAALSRYYQNIRRNGYASDFGGLWPDKNDFQNELQTRLRNKSISAGQHQLVKDWETNGFIILENAVPEAAIDNYLEQLKNLYQKKNNSDALVQTFNHEYKALKDVERNTPHMKLVDAYMLLKEALEVQFAEKIIETLELLFDDTITAFQSLTFERGSTQALHQDTPYVVVSSPMELVASWVALEDIQPGSGELMYIPGSHKIKETLFSGKYKNWKPNRDSNEEHDAHLQRILNEAKNLGLQTQKFLPKKGDVLLWHADLIHGGAPIENENLSRWSHVTHYCPASQRPSYFPTKNQLTKFNDVANYSSRFYS